MLAVGVAGGLHFLLNTWRIELEDSKLTNSSYSFLSCSWQRNSAAWLSAFCGVAAWRTLARQRKPVWRGGRRRRDGVNDGSLQQTMPMY